MRSIRKSQAMAVVLLCMVSISPAFADVFLLKSGARIRGEWLNDNEIPLRKYVVRWEQGGQLTVDSTQVAEHIREPESISEYHRTAPHIADSAAEQWRFAEWCRERGLQEQRKQHLWRVIELEPDHVEARHALGFAEVEGKWVTRKDYFHDRGFVYYQGKWRLPQEVDLLEERRDTERQEREWFGRLKAMRGQLGTERDTDAVRSLAAIQDPLALKALAENLRREKSQRVRLLFVNAVAKLRTPAAIHLLVMTALNDNDPEVFHACADRLVASQTPGLSKALTEVLKESNNMRINRAAYILGRLGDRKVIPELTAALVTTHQVPLPGNSRTSAAFVQPTSTGPSSNAASQAVGALNGDASFAAGNQPKSAPVQVANQEVLAALVKLSGGQSFGFDQRAWMNWWISASRSQ